MELLTLALASLVSCLLGAVVSWIAGNARHRREIDDLERDMRDELDERYAVYEELEQRVTRIVQAFDRHEQEFERRLANQRHSIAELKRALSEHEDFEARAQDFAERAVESRFVEELTAEDAAKAKDTDFLGLPDGEQEAFGSSAAQDVFAALSQMDAWEQHVETVSEAKQAEMELQSREIERLTDQVRRLEPLSATVYRREAEIEGWKRKYEELECALSLQAQALEGVVSELRPKAAELSDHERAERTLRERFEARLQQQVGELETRERRIAELVRQLDEARAELEQRAGELDGARTRVRELERTTAEVGELRAAARRVEAELEQQAALAASLRVQVDSQAAELELRADERGQLDTLRHEHLRSEARIDELRQEAEATRRELDELNALYAGVSGKNEWLTRSLNERESELAQRDEEIAVLTDRVRRAEHELDEARGSLEGHKSRIGDLMRDLDDATSKVRTRGSALSQAHGLLENLRPMIESLETTLHDGEAEA